MGVGGGGAREVLVSHGRSDPTLPFMVSGWLHQLLKSGGADVRYYPHGGGHDVGDATVLRAIGDFWAEIIPLPESGGAPEAAGAEADPPAPVGGGTTAA